MPKRRPTAQFVTAEGRQIPFKMHTVLSLRAIYRPVWALVGRIAFAWNTLHDNLSHLFQFLTKPDHPTFAYGVWFASDSDYQQRKMLRAAVEASHTLSQVQIDEILWVLNKIEESLRHSRNDAIHVPLMALTGLVDDVVRTWVETSWTSANPRVRKLRNKNLLAEFEEYAIFAERLADYAARMSMALRDPAKFPWPGRPDVPRAHRTTNEKDRRMRAKLPPHLREPS
jgi:hypothetical protein